MPRSRPNILCFITDQQRADHLGCYGNSDIQTPNIDRLAQDGITFTEFYVTNPLCMPSRATLFTGQYPQAHGVRENGIALPQLETVLPEMLRQSGYTTASFGKVHLNPYGIDLITPLSPTESYESFQYWEDHNDLPRPYFGFEHVYLTCGHGPYAFGHYSWEIPAERRALQQIENALTKPSGAKESWKSALDEKDHYNTRIADHTIEFLENYESEQPFFIWCSFPDPHHPYSPPMPYSDMYNPQQITFSPARRDGELDDLPEYFRAVYKGEQRVGGLEGGAQISDDHYREILAHTYGMISMVDHNVGRIMKTLEIQGLLDNTIVIFLSDHGDLMGDHWLINKGPFLFRGLTRIPMIWRLPEGNSAGKRTQAMVSAVDFYPTILDFAGLPLPPGVQGRSFKSDILLGDEPEFRERVYIEYDSTYLGERLRHIRSPEWALTYHANRKDGLLYNLQDDPQELYNLWNDDAYQSIKSHLLEDLLNQNIQAASYLPARKAHA